MKIIDPTPYLYGHNTLPAGFVPIARMNAIIVVCQSPHNIWMTWNESTSTMQRIDEPQPVQLEILRAAMAELGGKPAMAKAIGVSIRTIETWQFSNRPVPLRAAYNIAAAIARLRASERTEAG